VIRRTYEAALEDNISFLASAIAFDLLLTAIPFVVLLLGFVGYLVQHEVTTQQIDVRQLIDRFLPPHPPAGGTDGFMRLEDLFAGVAERRGTLTLIGIPLFVWFSTRLFGGLRAALNEVFDTDERRTFFVAKAVDAAMVGATGSLFVANAVLSAWVSYLEVWSTTALGTAAAPPWFWAMSAQLLAFTSSVALFYLTFKFLPSRRVAPRTALVAASFSAVAFEVAKQLFANYLTRFATVDRLLTDANLVAFVLFLVWLHYTAFVFLLGGEVAEMYDLVRMRRAQRVRLG
jgi:membrane protein